MRGLCALGILGAVAAASLAGEPVRAQQPQRQDQGEGHGQGQGSPQLDYMLQCQGCHGPNGTGTEQANIPTLIGLAERFLALPGGRAYLVQVPGVAQAPLDDRAIANLMNWILERYRLSGDQQRFAADFTPYSEQEVAGYRAEGPIDVAVTRARIFEGHASTN